MPIDVDGEPYSWRDGEDLLFDETYVHRAANRADQPRIIFFCDIAPAAAHAGRARASTASSRSTS